MLITSLRQSVISDAAGDRRRAAAFRVSIGRAAGVIVVAAAALGALPHGPQNRYA